MLSPGSRIASLDGLRGIAALIVVVYHASLTAEPWLAPVAWHALADTPLKLLTAGSEAVLVFFALSGLVVALPAMRPGFSWLRYYPSRLLRLYLPVAAALVLASLQILLVRRDPAALPEGAWIRDAQAATVTLPSVFSELSLLRPSYDIVNVLWSLRWELFFSLLLPFFVWVSLRWRRHAVVLAGAAIGLMVLGRLIGSDVLVYYPVFLLGSLAAAHLDDLRTVAGRPAVRASLPLILAGCLTLLIAVHLAHPVVPSGSPADRLLWGLSGVGAVGLVVLAVVWPSAQAALEWRPAQWLGKVSFSLYLVHAPILATLLAVVGTGRWWVAALLAIPLSIGVSALFHRLVERPSHVLSRAAGERLARTARRLSARSPVSGRAGGEAGAR